MGMDTDVPWSSDLLYGWWSFPHALQNPQRIDHNLISLWSWYDHPQNSWITPDFWPWHGSNKMATFKAGRWIEFLPDFWLLSQAENRRWLVYALHSPAISGYSIWAFLRNKGGWIRSADRNLDLRRNDVRVTIGIQRWIMVWFHTPSRVPAVSNLSEMVSSEPKTIWFIYVQYMVNICLIYE